MYKKMSDHPLIQDGWVPKVGDWTDKGIITKVGMLITAGPDSFGHGRFALTWLPSIEQLMDKLKNITYRIYYYWDSGYCLQVNSPFQSYKSNCIKTVLIQAVMHKKHSLRWTGERWE